MLLHVNIISHVHPKPDDEETESSFNTNSFNLTCVACPLLDHIVHVNSLLFDNLAIVPPAVARNDPPLNHDVVPEN